MEKIISIAKKLQSNTSGLAHLTHLTLKKGEIFGWDHTACVITYSPNATDAAMYLLHEFGHAALNHTHYQHDIDLIKMERAAWDWASAAAPVYGVAIDDETVEDALDGYRDWMHSRSLCPACGATGIQTDTLIYRCMACHTTWQVNEARTCALRRYPAKKRP